MPGGEGERESLEFEFSSASLAPAVVRAIEGAKEPATRVEALAFLRAALGDEANADAAKAVAVQDEGQPLSPS